MCSSLLGLGGTYVQQCFVCLFPNFMCRIFLYIQKQFNMSLHVLSTPRGPPARKSSHCPTRFATTTATTAAAGFATKGLPTAPPNGKEDYTGPAVESRSLHGFAKIVKCAVSELHCSVDASTLSGIYSLVNKLFVIEEKATPAVGHRAGTV